MLFSRVSRLLLIAGLCSSLWLGAPALDNLARSLKALSERPVKTAGFFDEVKRYYVSDWYGKALTKSVFSVTEYQDEFGDLLIGYLKAFETELENGTWIDRDKSWKNGYVKKLVVDSQSELFVHADYHSDIASLYAELRDLQNAGYLLKEDIFKIDTKKHPNFYMFMLGDFIDRGAYGSEVMYVLLKLALQNPGRVLLVKGNHETEIVNPAQFKDELGRKFGKEAGLMASKIFYWRLAPLLPDAIYVLAGTKKQKIVGLFCHGGPMMGGQEMQANLRSLLADPAPVAYQAVPSIDVNKVSEYYLSLHSKNPPKTEPNLAESKPNSNFNQYFWNDFSRHTDPQYWIPGPSGRNAGLALSKKATELYFNASLSVPARRSLQGSSPIDVRYVFRGHQNKGAGEGFGKAILDNHGVSMLWPDKPITFVGKEPVLTATLWPGCVCTFLVTPDTTYGKDEREYHPYDVYGIVRPTADGKTDWKLEIHQLPIQRIFELTGLQII